MPGPLSSEELHLVEQLRKEALDVKECFTRFSFQGLAFSAAALGIIFSSIWAQPLTGFASIFVIVTLLAIARIGVYKFSTSNRQLGYELHLYRTEGSKDCPPYGWQRHMRSIGWEEAMRAWRVVQATVYEHVYQNYDSYTYPLTMRPNHKAEPYIWFQQSSSIVAGASYHPGTYLKYMLNILYMAVVIALVTILIMFIEFAYGDEPELASISLLLLIFATGVFLISAGNLNARRRILEDGLLSIHSCAIMWQAVVVAHYRALACAQANHQDFRNYTQYLSDQACDLKANVFNLHEWIRDPRIHPRYGVQKKITVKLREGKKHDCSLVDLSLSGGCLKSKEQIDGVFTLIIEGDDIKAETVRCEHEQIGFRHFSPSKVRQHLSAARVTPRRGLGLGGRST
jgi:hypothetical protein